MGLMMQPHFRSGRPLSILPPLNAQHLSGDKAAVLESALVTELPSDPLLILLGEEHP